MKVALAIALSIVSVTSFAQTSSSRVKTNVAKFKTSADSTPVMTLEIKDESKKRASLSLLTHIRGRSVEDKFMSATAAGAIIEATAELKLAKKLTGTLVAGALMMDGAANNLYTAEGSSSSSVYIDEAAANFMPSPSLTFSGGIVPTSLSPTLSWFYPRGIPGVSEKLTGKLGKLSATLSANQVVPPTSGALKTSTGKAEEALLTVETLDFKFGDTAKETDPDRVELGMNATHFSFSNLTALTAQESRFLGSTVVGLGASAARFAYEYQGLEFGAYAKAWILRDKFQVGVKGSQITNTEAPEGSNKGYLAMVSALARFGNVDITPSYTMFYGESDILPGSYSHLRSSFVNRQGGTAGILTELREEKVKINATYSTQNEIKDLPYQADRTVYLLSVETTYDIL